jgi:hypothetical protein
MRFSAFLAAGILTLWNISSASDSGRVTVVASGETHAMLTPCDCPKDPGGGLAERATALKKEGNPKCILLLDAGGFAGGGIYDDYTGGRAVDSQRTVLTLRAMGTMGYDAVGIGDDDLQFGGVWLCAAAARAGVPLVSANCFIHGNKPIAPLYKIIIKNGIRFGVTAVAPVDRLFPIDDSCTIAPPVASIRKIWRQLCDSSDVQVILSHLGEEQTVALADSFSRSIVFVNGHRKMSSLPTMTAGSSHVLQFAFQGKKLSRATLNFAKENHSFKVENTGWITIERGIAPDSAVTALLSGAEKEKERPVFDLYIMGQCPYGIPALHEFAGFVKSAADIEWNVWFIGSVEKDSLLSLHGDGEARDEMAWLAVKSLYPGQWLDFLIGRGHDGVTTDGVINTLHFDRSRLQAWVKRSGPSALRDHYRRSTRLSVTASPTLLINNKPYEQPIEARRLAKLLCSVQEKKSGFCDSLPDCFDDRDCTKKGMLGRCTQTGKCEYVKDAAFTFTVLVGDSTLQHPENGVIATTEELFPNATIETITLGSARGRALVREYAPAALPLYLFDAGVATAHNWDRIESGLVKVKERFTFKPGITPKNFFPHRPKETGALRLFLDPLFPGSEQALRALSADSLLMTRVAVAPAIFSDPRNSSAGIEERTRSEETLRWLVIDSLFPKSYRAYCAASLRDPGNSYWFERLKLVGIPQEDFLNRVKTKAGMLATHWELLSTLGIKDPVTLLVDDRELVVVKNETEFSAILKSLAAGFTPKTK